MEEMKRSHAIMSPVIMNVIIFILSAEFDNVLTVIVINRQKNDNIDLPTCTNIPDARQINGKCACTNNGTILSYERGKINCYPSSNREIFTNCEIKTITYAAEFRQAIRFTSKCIAISVEKSAFWNINMTDEIRGYWVNRNDIKTFLTFDNNGNLLVDNYNKIFDGMFLKLNLLCNSTNISKCIMIKVYGAGSYPITQFNNLTTLHNTKIRLTSTSTPTTTTTTIKSKTPNKDGNIIIIVVAAVLTVVTIGIAWLYLRKKLKPTPNVKEDTLSSLNEMPHNLTTVKPTNVEVQGDIQESRAYETLPAKYASAVFHPSQDSEEKNRHYKELTQDFHDNKPQYIDLSNQLNEPEREKFPALPDMVSHVAETGNPVYQEGNYYSNVETTPDQLPDPNITYAKVKK